MHPIQPTFANHRRASLTSEPKEIFSRSTTRRSASQYSWYLPKHTPLQIIPHTTWRPLSRLHRRCVWIQLQSHPLLFYSPWPFPSTSLLPFHSQFPSNGKRSSLSLLRLSRMRVRRSKVSRLCPSGLSTAMLILASEAKTTAIVSR